MKTRRFYSATSPEIQPNCVVAVFVEVADALRVGGRPQIGARHPVQEVLDRLLRLAALTVDHGQMVAYEGDRPVETAKSGILRGSSDSKDGFGELRVKPIDPRSNQWQYSEEKTKVTG